MKSILKIIKSYCDNNKISISALEKKAGIGNGTISRWENSKPNLESLEKISDATSISLTDLLK